MQVITVKKINDIISKYHPTYQLKKPIDINIFKECFQDISLLKLYPDLKCYDRLEFLGDSILHLIISDYLFKRYPDQDRGFLTKLKISIEKNRSFVEFSKIIGIKNYIQVYNSLITDDMIEDVFESFIAGIYITMDYNYEDVYIFFVNLIESTKDIAYILNYDDNMKDILLRVYHQKNWKFPTYEKVNDLSQVCRIVRDNDGNIIGKGFGINVLEAEQNASKQALIALGVIENGEIDHNWTDRIKKEVEEDEQDEEKSPYPLYNIKNKLFSPIILEKFGKKYDIKFDTKNIDGSILLEALTHKLYVIRPNLNLKLPDKCVPLQPKSNDRLRYIGGFVLHFVIAEFVYNYFPNASEGELTNLRSKLKNKDTIFKLFKKCELDMYALISTKIEVMHGRDNVNIMGSCFIALMGAIYLLYGIKQTSLLIINIIKKYISLEKLMNTETNYKEMLSSYFKNNRYGEPNYRLIAEHGPDHAKKYEIGLWFNGNYISKSIESSKKKAEMKTAKMALKYFNN